MATAAATTEASPDGESAEAFWEEVDLTVKGPPLHEVAPRCESVRRLLHLHCRALRQASTQADVQELWSAEADVEEFAGGAVVEPLKEMARHLMWSVEEECTIGPVEVHLRSSSATHLERAHELCEQHLRPQLGAERAQAVWRTSQDCAWEVQRWKQRRHEEAAVHRLWADHHARRMGFDEDPPPLAGNAAVVALCCRVCRHWTSANATDGAAAREELGLREAALQIAQERAREAAPAEVIDAIADMQRELRRSAHLVRLTDRKSPGQLLSNFFRNTKGQSASALEAARWACDHRLAPLLGAERAERVWAMCQSCMWLEQNRYDYESAIGGRLTGARVGYLHDARRDWASVLENSAEMGFDSA